MKKNQHVVKNKDKWSVKGENNSKATKSFRTQKEAIKKARDIAKKNESELVIHGRDNKIRDKDSYGNDPYPPKDKKH